MTVSTLDPARDTAPAPPPRPVAASLAGLDRAGLAAALAAIGVPERETEVRVGQLHHWIYVRGARTFAAMTNVSKHLRAGAGGGLHAGPAGDRHRAGLGRRHPQMADADAADRPA